MSYKKRSLNDKRQLPYKYTKLIDRLFTGASVLFTGFYWRQCSAGSLMSDKFSGLHPGVRNPMHNKDYIAWLINN